MSVAISWQMVNDIVVEIFHSGAKSKLKFICLKFDSENSNSFSLRCSSSDHPELSGLEEVTVEDEAVLTLQCDILANPQVSSISWTINGSTVDLLAGGFTVTNDGFTSQLTTNKVDKSLHEGIYQCIAKSTMYGEYSKLFSVTVTGQFTQSALINFAEATSNC